MERTLEVNIGDRFGRLSVVGLDTVQKPGQRRRRAAVCQCDCGAAVTVLIQNLVRRTRSCGCLKRRGTMSERFAATRATPDRLTNLQHGLSKHPSYYRWFNMVDRCTNPAHAAYANYGGRGISVHPQWHDIATFLAYLDSALGPCPAGHSLDRIDNDGNYEPGNLRWATCAQQTRNRRSSVR